MRKQRYNRTNTQKGEVLWTMQLVIPWNHWQTL